MAKIVVIGGSIGGLFAANLLQRAGHEVCVLEKAAASLDGRGAGIVTHRPLIEALRRAGLSLDSSLGVKVSQRVVLGADGQTLEFAPLEQVLTSWGRLYTMLLSVLNAGSYHRAAAVQHIAQDSQGVTVTCQDGRTFAADIAIASDGIRSVVRAQFAPDVPVQYAGYVAWRGVCEEASLSQRTLSSLFERFGFGLPPGEQIIGYPVAGANNSTAIGHRRYNFVWYRPANEAQLKHLMTDADGEHHSSGIAPSKVAWQQTAAARRAASELLAPQFAEILEQTAQPFLQPIYDCASEQMAFGRIALMGDAAFVARPHVGMGATKAAEDAMALADSIAAHGATPQALQKFEQLRLAAGIAAVARGRLLGAYMQAQADASSVLSATERNLRKVMLETAIDLSDSALHFPTLSTA